MELITLETVLREEISPLIYNSSLPRREPTLQVVNGELLQFSILLFVTLENPEEVSLLARPYITALDYHREEIVTRIKEILVPYLTPHSPYRLLTLSKNPYTELELQDNELYYNIYIPIRWIYLTKQ